MKIKKILFPMFAFGALCMASCSSEDSLDVNNKPQVGEGIGYMAFTIANPESGTRAVGDENNFQTANDNEIYSNGDKNEYAICPNDQANVAFFFDKSNNFYSMCSLQGINNTGNDLNGSNGDKHPDDNYAAAEKYYTYIARWINTNADPTPTQVVVVLNADPTTLNTLAESLTTEGTNALNKVLTYDFETYNSGSYVYGVYKFGGENYFTMSNSSFQDAAGKDAMVTDITGKVFDTPEKALASPAVVYVERLLAKFQLGFGANGFELTDNSTNFTFQPFVEGATKSNDAAKVNYVAEYKGEDENAIDGGNIDYPRYQTVAWEAYITNWGINGLEKKANLFKDIATGQTNYFTGWNNTTYHRSYWGASPLYATNGLEEFPTQYRDASFDPNPNADFAGSKDYNPANETLQITALHYVSFNDLQNRARYKYTAERTYSNFDAGRTGYGPYRYASNYLIGAQLIFTGIDNDVTTKTGNQLAELSDKWYAYNFYWKGETEYVRYAYRRMATQIADGREHVMNIAGVGKEVKVQSEDDGYLYADAQGTKILASNAENYFTTTSARLIHGDGKRILAPKDGVTVYIRTGANTYRALDSDELTSVIYTYTDAARHYNKGAMYYSIPVQHMQGKTNGTKATISKDVTTANPYAFGQFGVVRNHWYRLTVSTIGSIGTPVDNPDQPIIPDPEDEYHVALEIVVLPWHLIDNGSVGL